MKIKWKTGDSRMWRWVNWAAKTLATALLLSFLCIWTTGYIVNSYMESLLKQLDLPLQTQPFALSGIWGKLWGANVPTESKPEDNAADPTPSAMSHMEQRDGSRSENGTENGSGSGNALPSPSGSPQAGNGSSGTEASGSPAPSGDDGSVPVFNNGNAGILDMSDQQRQLLRTVMAKLNAEQLGTLSGYLEDGLTEEEVAKIGDAIKPSLSESEYSQMMALLQERAGAAETPSEIPSEQHSGPTP